jgi:hypothetical protein
MNSQGFIAMQKTCNNHSTISLLHHVIGREATRCLTASNAFGGRSILVPKKEVGRGDKAFAALAEVIGTNETRRLCKHFGGEVIYIPRRMKEILHERNLRIVAAFNSGVTVSQLTAQFNLSDRRIWQILKQTDTTANPTH